MTRSPTRTRRWVAWALAALLCVGIACLVIDGEPAGVPTGPQPHDVGDAQESTPQLVGGTALGVGQDTDVATNTALEPEPDVDPIPDSEPAPEAGPEIRVRFEGKGPPPKRVVLGLIADGNWDDILTVRLRPAQTAQIPVRALRYQIHQPMLDGWTSDQFRSDVKQISDDLYEAVLQLPHQSRLVVRDAETKHVLPDAYAYRMRGNDDIGDHQPTPSPESLKRDPHRADDQGAILLPRTTRQRRKWWVGAPGHAWRRVQEDPDVASLDVDLPAGGALNVQVASPSALPPYAVRVVRLGDDKHEYRIYHGELVPSGKDSFRVQGLVAGTWRVLVGRDTQLFLSETWAHADVEVIAGRTEDVVVQVPARDAPVTHDLHARLIVPARWKTPPTHVYFRGATEENNAFERRVSLAPIGSPWTVSWEAVPSGLYEVTVYPFHARRYVRVPEDILNLELAVPPPVRVELDVVDAATGKAIPDAEVRVWYDVVRPPEIRSFGSGGDDARRELAGGPFVGEFRAGLVRFEVEAPGYVSHEVGATLQADSKTYRRTFKLARGGTVIVRILEGGEVSSRVPGSVGCWRSDATEDDEEHGWMSNFEGGIHEFQGVPAGSQLITVSLLERRGLKRVITVRPGGRHVVDFELPEK